MVLKVWALEKQHGHYRDTHLKCTFEDGRVETRVLSTESLGPLGLGLGGSSSDR